MEKKKVGALDRKGMVSVLTHGVELANELKKQLHPSPLSDSKDTCDSLLEKIVTSYEKALKLLDCMALLQNGDPTSSSSSSVVLALGTGSTSLLGPPNSIHEASPRSSTARSDQDSKDQGFKKRKTMAKWSEQVRMRTRTGLEGQLDDGYQWRKYGQKDILGSVHPRAYYRCTHRDSQGCLATKQVQRADDDPSMCVVVYRGKHSCVHERIIKHEKENSILPVPKKKEEGNRQQQNSQKMTLMDVKYEEETHQDSNDTKEDHAPCFSIPSTPCPTLVDDHYLYQTQSAHFSCFSQCQLPPIDQFLYEESDFAEIISFPVTSADSNIIQVTDLDSLDKESFDSHHLIEAFFQ